MEAPDCSQMSPPACPGGFRREELGGVRNPWRAASLPPSPSVSPVERASLARPALRACQVEGVATENKSRGRVSGGRGSRTTERPPSLGRRQSLNESKAYRRRALAQHLPRPNGSAGPSALSHHNLASAVSAVDCPQAIRGPRPTNDGLAPWLRPLLAPRF